MCGHLLTGFNSSWPHKEGFCILEIKDEETHFNLEWVVIQTIVSCFLERHPVGKIHDARVAKQVRPDRANPLS